MIQRLSWADPRSGFGLNELLGASRSTRMIKQELTNLSPEI